MPPPAPSPQFIARHIVSIEDRPVLLDCDLARLHGLTLRRVRLLMRQHLDHFPGDLCFQPNACDLPPGYVDPQPNAFTEHGAWMTAALLGSPAARKLTIDIARAFALHRRDPRA